MEYKNMNIFNLITAKLRTFANSYYNLKVRRGGLNYFKFVKDLTSPYSKEKNRMGLYLSQQQEKVVLKRHKFMLFDMDFMYINNEAYVLSVLNSIRGINKIFPEIIGLGIKNEEIVLATEYLEGVAIEKLNKKKRIKIIRELIENLQQLNGKLAQLNSIKLASRGIINYLAGFLINLIKLSSKDYKNFISYIYYGSIFYYNYILSLRSCINIGLAHRDLYPDNILFSKKTKSIKILDWESAVLTDEFFDLAQLTMIYYKDLGIRGILEILNEKLEDNNQRMRFFALAVYNSIQILSLHKVTDQEFLRVFKFLRILSDEIWPKIFYIKSPFELIFGLTLDLIGIFYKLTGLNNISSNKKIVLCYHSVSNSGWRFSSRIKFFNEQIEFLNKNYNLVGLDKLLKTKGGGINITFDDGYLDVFENAYPKLKKMGVCATMFALGRGEKPNREELDNSLRIVGVKELRFLKKNGWEIGFHTNTHSDLFACNDRELYEEIVLGKEELERKLGFKINYFAYPKGKYSEKIIEVVKKGGYKGAFTVDGADLEFDNKYLLDRVPMEGELSVSRLEALLSPIGLKVAKFYMKVLQIKERISVSARKVFEDVLRKPAFNLERQKL